MTRRVDDGPVESWESFITCRKCKHLFHRGSGISGRKVCHCLLSVWTDGCCRKNGQGNAKGGIGVWFNVDHDSNFSGPLDQDGPQTSQRAEIAAVLKGIEISRDIYSSQPKRHRSGIKVHTDSKYVIKCMTERVYRWRNNGWRNAQNQSVSNRDLLEELDDLISGCEEENISITFQHIPREYNKPADKLAREGADMSWNNETSSELNYFASLEHLMKLGYVN